MSLLRRNFKVKVNDDLRILNGEEFEQFTKFIFELILNESIIHKGQNLYAKPVGYTADFADSEYEIIGQSGTDADYFDDFKKPLKDVKAAIKNHSSAKKIYLFSNRYAGTSRLGDLKIKLKNDFKDQQVIVYDSERIADIILGKILATHIVDDVFKFMPSAYELYRMLPGTNNLPPHKDQYYNRHEELKIIKQLNKQSVIQIYGLSGIGKTEITIGIGQRIGKSFETIIWVEGDAIQNTRIDFNAIKISKFDKLFNLAATLESYKVLVIFDNINVAVDELINNFKRHNKNGSQCLISSLVKSVDSEVAYPLLEISRPIAGKIIFGDEALADKSTMSRILKYTGRHPLILKIIKSAIKNKVLTWDSLIAELSNLNLATDNERNQTIANRIIGHIKLTSERELAALKYIDSRLVCKALLEKMLGRIGIEKLKNYTVIGNDGAKYHSIHQIILDSIKTELTSIQWQPIFEDKIKEYLIAHNEVKDIGFYSVIFNHERLLHNIQTETKSTELKRIIVYSMMQGTDIKNSNRIDELCRYAADLIDRNDTYYENLLSIELGEIRLWKIDKKTNREHYYQEAAKELATLNSLLKDNLNENYQATLLHHIGKLYLKLGESDKALEKFEKVLALKNNDPFALLQIARIKKSDNQRLAEIVEYIFELSDCPLSILLSFYELIINNNPLRERYIDDNIAGFTSKIIEAIDSRYDQPYNIIAKLSRDLSYNYPEYFNTIIDSLPTPSNLDYNEDLRFNYGLILSSYYKYGDIDKEPEKMRKAIVLAISILANTRLESDYKKGIYVDVLIADKSFDSALQQLNKFTDRNEFYFQKLSKTYRGMGLYAEAIRAADDAINFHKGKGNVFEAYLSAFLNDKAEAQYIENKNEAISTLNDAILLQPNSKTKKEWAGKLIIWSKN